MLGTRLEVPGAVETLAIWCGHKPNDELAAIADGVGMLGNQTIERRYLKLISQLPNDQLDGLTTARWAVSVVKACVEAARRANSAISSLGSLRYQRVSCLQRCACDYVVAGRRGFRGP